jgi:lysophospholipase L1-like esterase
MMKPLLTADLAAITTQHDLVLFNLGANDAAAGLPEQVQWEADAGYILDAFHAKWPLAKVYMMRVYRVGYEAACDTVDGWIANVVAARPGWAFLGPDERTFLPGNLVDDVHPTVAGYVLTAQQWRSVVWGY